MSLLKREILRELDAANVELPVAESFDFSETILQFGTGVLLKGLPDYYVHRANQSGHYRGRILVVKSTDHGTDDLTLAKQDYLYTHCIEGVQNGALVRQCYINNSISRIIRASEGWNIIVEAVTKSGINIIISNTTEAGMKLDVHDAIGSRVPLSFPAKLLALLHARYIVAPAEGFTILPTELLTNNGKLLRDLVVQLATKFQMEPAFIAWIDSANEFCNTLVDRIVPGKLNEEQKQALQASAGYTDEAAIVSEPYNLWAIEAEKPESRERLAFAHGATGIRIADDIKPFVEQKLRLLNATHTLSCGVALLGGFTLVREAMSNSAFRRVVSRLMHLEIIPCIAPTIISKEEARAFAEATIDRFSNPFINHAWSSIAVEYTNKVRIRVLPLLHRHRQHSTRQIPTIMVRCLAAYLLYTRQQCLQNATEFKKLDTLAAGNCDAFKDAATPAALAALLGDSRIWGDDSIAWPEFAVGVELEIERLQDQEEEAVHSNLFNSEN